MNKSEYNCTNKVAFKNINQRPTTTVSSSLARVEKKPESNLEEIVNVMSKVKNMNHEYIQTEPNSGRFKAKSKSVKQ